MATPKATWSPGSATLCTTLGARRKRLTRPRARCPSLGGRRRTLNITANGSCGSSARGRDANPLTPRGSGFARIAVVLEDDRARRGSSSLA
jgi:hypothetical protein